MRMSEVGRWFVIGALALSTVGACGGQAVTGPDQAGPVNQDSGPACGCDATPHTRDTAHQPLSCRCGAAGAPATCTATLSTFDTSSWCATSPVFIGVLRITGCGRVAYAHVGGGTSEVTFDVATGAVVGEADAGDVAWGACNVNSYEWGTTSAACADNVTCTFCGTSGTSTSPPSCT
jgi:hypothetical protein